MKSCWIGKTLICTTCCKVVSFLRTHRWLASSTKSSATTACSDTLTVLPGRMRRACIVLWAGLTAYGLFHLLGLTGLSLACVYVTAGLRRCCAEQRLRSNCLGPWDGLESGETEPPVAAAPPLIGAPLGCWVCPWCVAFPQPGGHVAWVFKDEVSPADYACLRRRLLVGGG